MAASLPLRDRLAALPVGDRRLLEAMVGLALVALGPGLVMGALFAMLRAGWLEAPLGTGYTWLTLHGVGVFFFWLYLAQGALLLALAATAEGADGIAHRRLAAAGLGIVALGLGLAWAAPLAGPALLYDASPALAAEDRRAAGLAYAGYLVQAAGLALIAGAALASVPRAKRAQGGVWSTVAFGTAAWAGLLIVSVVAAVATFLPAALWTLDMAPLPTEHTTRWHLLFHNLHYLPLLGTVLVWYVLVAELTGIRSALGERFSKLVFTSYLLLVPPTSLYHMFLEPGLAPGVRLLGSLLSLLIGVPTVAVFLIIVVSIETELRARGARGPLGWLRALPWHEPTLHAMAAAVVNLALGGTLAFVLIQERLAPLLSDTFTVPAYFHFLTVGTVSLTALAALAHLLPGLRGRGVPAPRLRAALPWLLTLGLLMFGLAGLAAGLTGMPRRVAAVAYGGAAPAAWTDLSAVIALGAVVMSAALLAYALLVVLALLGVGGAAARPAVVEVAEAGWSAAALQPAWSGPVAVAVLILAMAGATWLAVHLMAALPVSATAAGGS
ncbi:MAG: cbb3-type cytochrome c oxidase subunit I [Geminicoccaceae bacterium]|nr:cbb3-type cytochrome c oxidase subunit I [Geminicoccaceae bacterium]